MSRVRTLLDRFAGPALAVVLTLIATAHAMQLWRWRPGTPFGMRGDEIFIHAEITTTLETGWFWTTDSLGYPFEMSAYLFPETSVLQLLIVRILGLLIPDPFSLGFVYFVLGFPLAALAFYWLARSEGINRSAAVATAVLFAMAPGHQLQFGHLWLASLWIVPIVVWLAVQVARGQLLARPRGPLAIALAVIALSNIYYAAFAMILIVTLALLRRLGGGPPAELLGGLAGAAVIGIVASVPLVIARRAAGSQTWTGPPPASRLPAESERYAGKLMDLLLPWHEHRVDVARLVTQAYNGLPTATVERPALGLAGLTGAIVLTFVGMHALTHPGRQIIWQRETSWAVVGLVSFLFYTVGGLGSFVAFFVTPQLRTWSRWYIVILAVGLLAVAALVQQVAIRSRLGGMALAGLVMVLGVLDQTNPAVAPDYEAERERLAGLRQYTAQLTTATGGDCAVLQLPVTRFPEGAPREGTRAYDQLMPYTAGAPELSWSFGAMSGTPSADWQLALDPSDIPTTLQDARALDFCAIEVDTAAYGQAPASAETAVSPVQSLVELAGEPISSTPDGRFAAFRVPIREAADPGTTLDLDERRDYVLRPILVSVNGSPGQLRGASYGNMVGPRSRIAIANLGDQEVEPVEVSLSIEPLGEESRLVSLRQGGMQIAEGVVGPGASIEFEVIVPAPPGRSFIDIVIDGDLAYSLSEGRSASAIIRDLEAVGPAGVRVVSIQTPRGP